MRQIEILVQTSQFADKGRRHKITRLDARLHALNNQFGRGEGDGRQKLLNARRALQSGAGEWTDNHGKQHRLEKTSGGYTETVFELSKPNLGRNRFP